MIRVITNGIIIIGGAVIVDGNIITLSNCLNCCFNMNIAILNMSSRSNLPSLQVLSDDDDDNDDAEKDMTILSIFVTYSKKNPILILLISILLQ